MIKRFFIFIICIITSIVANANSYSISNQGKNLIKEHEGCYLESYWDSNGYSIGYGHHGADVKKHQRINQRTAEKLFTEDIEKVNKSINRLIDELPYKYKFSQGFIDGFGSMIYNCGENGIRTSHFYQTLKKCRVKNGHMNINDLKYTIAFVKSTRITSEGHKTRRTNEMKCMMRKI